MLLDSKGLRYKPSFYKFMNNIVSAPRTDSYHFRINPEVRKEVEAVYAKNGISFTQAINIFIQQSLHVNLYLAIVGLLAVTALYTIAGTTGQGVLLGEVVGRSCDPSYLFLARLLMFQYAKTLPS